MSSSSRGAYKDSSSVYRAPYARFRAVAAAAALGIGSSLPVPANAQSDDGGTPVTAGLLLKEMPPAEFTTYTLGIVEGLAYARFLRDTEKSGRRNEDGMGCIHRWYHGDTKARFNKMMQAFEKYSEHHPTTILYAMIKKECGE